MKKQIAVLPGDGIGPEITAEAIKVLDCVAKKYNKLYKSYFLHKRSGQYGKS